MQTCDAVEFCQAVAAGTAVRHSEEGRGRTAWPASPHARNASSAMVDGLLASVDERHDALAAQARATSPFAKQSRITWDTR